MIERVKLTSADADVRTRKVEELDATERLIKTLPKDRRSRRQLEKVKVLKRAHDPEYARALHRETLTEYFIQALQMLDCLPEHADGYIRDVKEHMRRYREFHGTVFPRMDYITRDRIARAAAFLSA